MRIIDTCWPRCSKMHFRFFKTHLNATTSFSVSGSNKIEYWYWTKVSIYSIKRLILRAAFLGFAVLYCITCATFGKVVEKEISLWLQIVMSPYWIWYLTAPLKEPHWLLCWCTTIVRYSGAKWFSKCVRCISWMLSKRALIGSILFVLEQKASCNF